MHMWAEHRDRAARNGFIQVMALLGASFVALEVIVYNAVGGRAGLGHSGLVLLLVVVQLALQGGVLAARSAEPGAGPSRAALLALTAQLAVVLLATQLVHEACGVLAGTLSGSLPLILRARYAWPLFGLVIALVSMLCTRDAGSLSQALPHLLLMAGAIVVVGLMSYTLTQAVLLIHRTRCARHSIAKAVVEREQNRLARDLHDLLGHTFSAVALRAELVNRSFKVSPERAAAEAQELVRTSRQAMAEFRMAVRGYQGVSLAAEVPTAASLLRAMNIGVTLRIDALPEGEDASLALAAVLRESVTNVLRHSKATHCGIALTGGGRSVRLEVTNDGAAVSASRLCGAAPGSGGSGGAGLGNLGQRVSELGGSFHTEIRPGGVFRVVAEIPARAVDAPPRSGDGTAVVHPPAVRRPDIRRRAARIAVPAAGK